MAIPSHYRDAWSRVPEMKIKVKELKLPLHRSSLRYRLAAYNTFYPSMSRKKIFLLHGFTSRVMTGFFQLELEK